MLTSQCLLVVDFYNANMGLLSFSVSFGQNFKFLLLSKSKGEM